MKGILASFRRSDPPTYTLAGVPIFANRGYVKKSALICGFLQGFMWCHEKTAARNLDFPSWSWAGWNGGLFDHNRPDVRDTYTQWDCDVNIEKGDRLVPFPDLDILPKVLEGVDSDYPYIHIKVRYFLVDLVYNNDQSITAGKTLKHEGSPPDPLEDGFFARLNVDGTQIFMHFYLDRDVGCEFIQNVIGLVILQTDFFRVLMFVEERESHYERFGIAIGRCLEVCVEDDTYSFYWKALRRWWEIAAKALPTKSFRLG